MSKISIFKFKINRQIDIVFINNIMNNYLYEKGFKYYDKEKCYMNNIPSQEIIDKIESKKSSNNIFVDFYYLILWGRFLDYDYFSYHKCLEYEIDGNYLIIKAYTIDLYSNVKYYIHITPNTSLDGRDFYNDLRNNLFNILNKNNIVLENTETEKINTKEDRPVIRNLFLSSMFILIIVVIIAIIIYKIIN